MNTELWLQFAVYGVLIGTTYGLLATPIGLTYAAVGTVDAAVGGYAVLAALVAATVGGIWGILLGVAVAVAASLVTGQAYRAVTARTGADGMPFVLATFGVMTLLGGVLQRAFGTQPKRLTGLPGASSVGPLRLDHQSLLNFGIGIAVAVAMALIIYRTRIGRELRAGADRPGAASLIGIRLQRLHVGVFAVQGLLAGGAGILYVYTIGVGYATILGLTLSALAGAIICGLRGPLYAFLGGVVFGVLQSLSVGLGHGGLATALPYLLVLLIVSVNRGVAIGQRP
jgi:branched-chain amino acid transport system permease protein